MNILEEAKSYLEEQGIDTSLMTEEEIINKYYELLADKAVDEIPAEDVSTDEQTSDVALDTETPTDNTDLSSTISSFLDENAEIINSFNEEQKLVFEKLIDLLS